MQNKPNTHKQIISLLKYLQINKLKYTTNYYSSLSKKQIITIYYNTSPQFEYLTYNKNFYQLNNTNNSITYQINLP
mgnify:CR=1 FL=1|jgi:hypothetical protein